MFSVVQSYAFFSVRDCNLNIHIPLLSLQELLNITLTMFLLQYLAIDIYIQYTNITKKCSKVRKNVHAFLTVSVFLICLSIFYTVKFRRLENKIIV
jgi:hypothetical protein